MRKKVKKELRKLFIIPKELMEDWNIPEVEKINNLMEYWAYVQLEDDPELTKQLKYMVSTYGRVFNYKNSRLLTIDSNGWSSKVASYRTVSLFNGIERRHVLVHRLVAQAFIPKTEEDLELGRNLVNHLDGNPSHNWAWNLEWCTNGENMQHAVDTGLWVLPKGENRSTSKWTDDEVRIICAMMAEGHKATYIYHALLDMLKDADKVQYERVRTLYKHIIRQTHWKHIAKDYNIDYTRFNYKKEAANVKAKQAS